MRAHEKPYRDESHDQRHGHPGGKPGGIEENFPGSEYTPEQISFMQAMETYKRINRRPFPTWEEVLKVIHSLGYRIAAPAAPLPGTGANRPG